MTYRSVIFCREQNDGNLPRFFSLLENGAGLKSIHFRHGDIQNDNVDGGVMLYEFEALLAVGGSHRSHPFANEELAEQVGEVQIVIDDKHGRRCGGGRYSFGHKGAFREFRGGGCEDREIL